MKLTVIVGITLVISACALPETKVQTGSSQPGLFVQGAPAGAVLYVDGLSMGAANQFDGNPKVLAVLEGVHVLEVRQGTAVIFHDKALFSNGETHPIRLQVGGGQ